MQGHGRRLIATGVALVATTIPVSANAATQVGQTFAPITNNPCSGGVTYIQSGSPQGQYAAPFAGVMTSWSYQASGVSVADVKFKVFRPQGSSIFTAVGEDGPRAPVASTPNTYPVQIPVQPGDVIGLYLVGNSDCFGTASGPASGYEFKSEFGDPSPGDGPVFFSGTGFIQLDVSAILEADCDNDGFGDETQDPSLLGGSCPLRGRTVTLDANKNKLKRGKRVTLSGRVTEVVRQGECQSGQTVQLQRKRPIQAAFTTVEQLQTDASGGFSAKQRVKKTFQYRAEVAETATCGGGLSNTEKVKVKKPK